MERHQSCSISGELVLYVIGEISEKEHHFIEEHLLNCSACRQEVKELQEAWDLIPYELEEVDIPANLKEDVMNAIFEPSEPLPQITTKLTWWERCKKRMNSYRFMSYRAGVAVLLFIVVVGLIWNNLTLREQLTAAEQRSHLPTEVLQVFTLKSTDSSMDSTKGNAWLFEQGNTQKLVLHLQGLAATKGPQAYQVWLIHEGKRKSAGVFRVDEQGNGVLTYDMTEKEEPFEAIGITLEPDADGTQPRGKKVLGT